MKLEEKLRIVSEFSEKQLVENVVIPLLENMGFKGITKTHGQDEQGTDLICWKENGFCEREYIGVQVKTGKIHGSAGKSGNATEILTQAQQAFSHSFIDISNGKPKNIDKFFVMTSGDISISAKKSVEDQLKNLRFYKTIRFLDGKKLIELIDRYVPSFFWEEYNYFNKYFDAMRLEFETIKDISAIGQKEPIPLEKIYISLRLSEKTEHEVLIDKEITERKDWKIAEEKRKKEQVFDADNAARRFDKMIIVGAPGSGKTTLLKHLALKSCKENLEKQARIILPVLIELRPFSESQMNLREYIDVVAEQYKFPRAKDFLERDLREGRCQLLLDGFDELATQEMQHEVTRKIEEFVHTYPKNRFIVTSRIAGYHDELKGFQKLELMEFDDQQIERFTTNWFGKVNPEKARLLNRTIKENERIRAIARNPLMITIVAIIYEEDRELPQRRVELYERCVDVLLSKWDITYRIRNKYEAKAKEKILRKLALETHISGKRTFTKDEILERFSEYLPEVRIKKEESENVLNEIVERNALLKEISIGVYDFLHLSFQEYLAALELRERRDYKTFLEHLYESWWEEVILLFAGFDRDATELISQIWEKERTDEMFKEDIFFSNLILLGKCIADADYTDAQVRNQIVADLWSLYQKAEFSSLREKAIGVLSLIKPEDILEVLIEEFGNQRKTADIREKAVEALGRIGSEKAIEPLIDALTTDKESKIRGKAAEALGWIGSEKAIEPLLRALTTDEERHVRGWAADALGWIGSEKAIEPLLRALTTDEERYVRGSAAEALGWIGSEKAIEPLIEALTTDEERHVRGRSAYGLRWIGSEKAIDPLLRILTTDKDSHVRGSAAEALGWIGSEKEIEPLIRILSTDEERHVRGKVAGALGRIGSERAVESLIEALTTDEDSLVRGLAAEALGWIGSEKAVEPLIEALTTDKKGRARLSAAYALGHIGSGKAIEPLIEALTTDEDNGVRGRAAKALGWIGSEKAVGPLISALTTDEDSHVRGSAAEALGRIGSEKAIEPLRKALEDLGEWIGREKVRDEAFNSLEKISKRIKKRIFKA